MKITKSLKRPVVVILLVAVIGIIVFSVARYLMGDKEQFVEGICNTSVASAYIYDNSRRINGVSDPNCVAQQLTSDSAFASLKIDRENLNRINCAIDTSSANSAIGQRNLSSIIVGCKSGTGQSGRVNPTFDLTKCTMNSNNLYNINKDASGNFACPTVGPTTRPTTKK
jgi:hypothetical protein